MSAVIKLSIFKALKHIKPVAQHVFKTMTACFKYWVLNSIELIYLKYPTVSK